MAGSDFLRLLSTVSRLARGPGGAFVYFTSGVVYYFFMSDWDAMSADPSAAWMLRFHATMTYEAVIGLMVAFAGLGLLLSKVSRMGKILGLGALARMRAKGQLTEYQFEVAKMFLLREASESLLDSFVSSLDRVRPHGIADDAIAAVRSFVKDYAATRNATSAPPAPVPNSAVVGAPPVQGAPGLQLNGVLDAPTGGAAEGRVNSSAAAPPAAPSVVVVAGVKSKPQP